METPRELQRLPVLGEWTRRDIQHCRFKYYDLTCAFYSKFPSWGCQRKPITYSAYFFLPRSNIHSFHSCPIHSISLGSMLEKLQISLAARTFLISLHLRHVNSSFKSTLFQIDTSLFFLIIFINSFFKFLSSKPNSSILSSSFQLKVDPNSCKIPVDTNFLSNSKFDPLKINIFPNEIKNQCLCIQRSKVRSSSAFQAARRFPAHPVKMLNSLLKIQSANSYFQFQQYAYNNLYYLIFVENDSGLTICILFFNSTLVLFSWWRNKISWNLCGDFHCYFS